MATPKPRNLPPPSQQDSGRVSAHRIQRDEILRQIHEDLRNQALESDEGDDWDEFVALIDAERPEGQKLFPKT